MHEKKVDVYCFPYAGGSSRIFSTWEPLFDDSVNMKAIELAGRGNRIMDAQYNNIEEVVNDIISRIEDDITTSPYVFFGHSMGAIIVHELAREIERRKLPPPLHLFFSGIGAPYFSEKRRKNYHLLSDEEFKIKIKSLGGTPKEFFKEPELLELFLPILRNDFKLVSTDFSANEIIPFKHDISVFLGKDENLKDSEIIEWKNYTNKKASIHFFEGGHFFINQQKQEVVNCIVNKIKSIK